MAASGNKQQFLAQVLTHLKEHYQPAEGRDTLSVLEHLLYAICREGTTRAQADRAFRDLRQQFFDFNEIRVSTDEEIAEVLGDLPEPIDRARRLIAILQEWFEMNYNFDMEEIGKKGTKEGAKHLVRLKPHVNDYHVAWVVQQSFGGHAIPLDAPALRVLQRLEVVDPAEADPEAVRVSIEHAVTKAKGPLFVELIALLAHDICLPDVPQCERCPLNKECPTGIARLAGQNVDVAKSRKSR